MKPVSVLAATSAAVGLALFSSLNCVALAGDDATGGVAVTNLILGSDATLLGLKGSFVGQSGTDIPGGIGWDDYVSIGESPVLDIFGFNVVLMNPSATATVILPNTSAACTVVGEVYGDAKIGTPTGSASSTVNIKFGSVPLERSATLQNPSFDVKTTLSYTFPGAQTIAPGQSSKANGSWTISLSPRPL